MKLPTFAVLGLYIALLAGCSKDESSAPPVSGAQPSTPVAVDPAPPTAEPAAEVAAPAAAEPATPPSAEPTALTNPLGAPVKASKPPVTTKPPTPATPPTAVPTPTPTPASGPTKPEVAKAEPTAPAPAAGPVDPAVERSWRGRCASCHGKDGRGKTAQGTKMGIEDMTTAAWQKRFSNAQLRKATQDGLKREKNGKAQEMKPYAGKLSDAEIDGLVAYMRSLAH